MIIDFINGNGGGGGGTTDTTMRASGFTSADFSNNILSFNNLNGTEVDSVNLSGLTPDLSDYYTKEEIDAGTSGITEAVSVLAGASQQHTEAIGRLQTAVSANTAAIAELSGSTGGDATELQAVNAIPESGAAGTLIAINKPDEYGWTSYITGSGKSRTQIYYYVEPSENPNPDLSLYPTRYEIDVRYADTVDENGNYSYNNQTTVELSVDYQGNITFTNLGNFSQDGDVYSLTSDIYNTSTGENIQKTLYMSLENGYLYFNNGQGDCPYDMGNMQYQYYWRDMGSWDESDPENPVWQESWSEMINGIGFQSWGISSPAKIGIYQANSANTYVEIKAKNADYAKKAGFTTLIKAYEDNGGDFHNDYFNTGDMIVPSSSDYRPRVKTGDGDGFDGDFESLAYQGEVNELGNRLNNLKIEEVYAKEDTPIYVDNGNLIAVHNSGETVVKQAYAESGFTYVPMGWGDTEYYGIKQSDGVGIGLYVQVGDGTNRAWIGLSFDGSSWDFSDMNDWSINQTDTLTWDATDNYGYGWTLNAYNDGSYNYVEFSQPVVEFYGGSCEEKRVPQTAYQTAVMSKQGVCQIWKGTAQEYAQISTPDANTLYIIL